jgi:hypothetical protein
MDGSIAWPYLDHVCVSGGTDAKDCTSLNKKLTLAEMRRIETCMVQILKCAGLGNSLEPFILSLSGEVLAQRLYIFTNNFLQSVYSIH